MDAINAYLDQITGILQKVRETQQDVMRKAAQMLCDATLNGGSIFAFGCGHGGLLALEMYYRTGGMANINPIRAPGLNLDIDPAIMTSQLERLNDYGRIIIDNSPVKAGDVVVIHSVSGRNTVIVDAAVRSRELGAKVIALTSMEYRSVSSRHPSGTKLFENADLVIDNCGYKGDASLTVPGIAEKVAPTSTAVGAVILNAVVAQAAALVAETGRIAPVFISGNIDGGDEHNSRVIAEYKDRIHYM